MTGNGEKDTISVHEVRIYRTISGSRERWFTSKEIATEADVAGRTARLHALRFSKLGLVDQSDVFPGYRYRWSEFANQRNKAYLQRLEAAAKILDP